MPSRILIANLHIALFEWDRSKMIHFACVLSPSTSESSVRLSLACLSIVAKVGLSKFVVDF